MQITYAPFTSVPPAPDLASAPAAALWYLLGADLRIEADGSSFAQPDFPLFRLAALLRHWLAYRPAPLDESQLGLAEYEAPAALIIRRLPQRIALSWNVDGRPAWAVTVLDVEFARASAVFLEQLQADVQQQLGLDMRPHLKGIPF